MSSFSIRLFVYRDRAYDMFYDESIRSLYNFLYGRIGLQRLFGMKGIKLNINFEIQGTDTLGFETFPTSDNLR